MVSVPRFNRGGRGSKTKMVLLGTLLYLSSSLYFTINHITGQPFLLPGEWTVVPKKKDDKTVNLEAYECHWTLRNLNSFKVLVMERQMPKENKSVAMKFVV